MPDANSPTAPRKVTAAERRLKAVELRTGGLSLQQIAEKLGVKKQSVHSMLTVAMAETAKLTNETAEILRLRENERLDVAQAAIWGAVMNGDIQAVQALIKLMARRAAMNGLDAPTKQEIAQTIETIQPYDYISAVAAIAPRPDEDSDERGENQNHSDGAALGQDADGG